MIELRNVSKVYGEGARKVTALNNVSLKIKKGEMAIIMGPSGSGKSTMLHVLGSLIRPTEGEVLIDGRALGKCSNDELTIMRRRAIGFIFQFFNLMPNLTAEENVALPLLLDGKRMGEVKGKAKELLTLVGLSHRFGHKPEELSGGEMQRVSIARALASDPPVILADEPTGNLDTKAGSEVMGLLKMTSEKFGKTIVVVSHDPAAAAYGSRKIAVRDGEIQPGNQIQ